MTRARQKQRTERILASDLVAGTEVATSDERSYIVRSAMFDEESQRMRVVSDTGWIFSMPAETKLVRIERYVRLSEDITP